MRTKYKLNNAFKNAKRIPIDENTKIIMFSDVHRGDNSLSDEFAHNQTLYHYALEYYYRRGYTYIELGDGDEMWEHKHFRHIRYAHSDIFMLLKKFYDDHRFEMIYGNHNMEFKYRASVKRNLYQYKDEFTDKIEPLFPGIKVLESIVLEHESKDIFLLHGHQGDFTNDQLWLMNRFFLRYFWRFMHIVGFRNPASPAKNIHHRHTLEKRYSKWIREKNQMLIMGHTHRPKFSEKGDLPYFNTGTIVHPRNITGIEIVDNQIQLVAWKVGIQDDGILQVQRRVIRGPRKISDI
ncbi:serine/threonine protein phosphatase [Acidaminobacter sp. JC074]|uniref:metallophosphoesterase family protein n=1 Tax=Acidaminobacter sp. JC074 TaxID=2530199 RepID=UPI001F0DB69D|nr:metallophosphoesterase family protein [Acidaminobacter sp. JC074]MCH4890417.1 serine/threonine protein phosphatase [Acidaminobacter sp. JC074]